MATMQLVQTSFSEGFVHIRYANHADPARSTEWIDFQAPISELRDPQNRQMGLGNLDTLLIGEFRLAALRHAREALAAETQRLAPFASPRQ
jgi:hypothetical protein